MLFIYVEIVYFLNKFNNLYQGEERPEKTTQRQTIYGSSLSLLTLSTKGSVGPKQRLLFPMPADPVFTP